MKKWGRIAWDGLVMFKWEILIHPWEKNEFIQVERTNKKKKDNERQKIMLIELIKKSTC